jgi:cytochrome c peroxidase
LAFRDSTAQTEDYMTLGFGGTSTNESGKNYIAYLFATLPGVSKVGSYTGNGSSQTIDCGFTSGARFVLIKRTDNSNWSWYVYDTARGIVAGNDPN